MDSSSFDRNKALDHAAQAKASWGTTAEYHEFEEKSKGRTKEEQQKLNVEMMEVFAEFGKIRDQAPDSAAAVDLALRLQEHITENYYTCSDEILLSLGTMYAGGGEFTENIDKVGGEGTAVFACRAIAAYCAGKK